MDEVNKDGAGVSESTAGEPGKYLSSGVPGLDLVLGGGILRRGFYLVQGDPGSGKTTLAIQFARERIRQGESVLHITISESLRDLERTATSHGWTMDGIQVLDLSKESSWEDGRPGTLFHPAEIELGKTTQRILAEVERRRPENVVFDGLGELRMLSGDAFTYRRQLLALKGFFEERGITVVMLDDRTTPYGQSQPETLVGANILMEKTLPGYGGARRRICVTKVRGGDFQSGYHDYEILSGTGVNVHPRLIAARASSAPRPHETFSSGKPGLDNLTGGGLPGGTTTLILGPSGVGKSTVSMQFVAAALERGIPAAVYTFDEVLDTFFERTEKLCAQDVRKYVASGLLHAQQVNPAELSPGIFAREVQRAVTEQGARIVVMDSLNGYISAMPEERFLQTHLHELFTYLDNQGVMSIMIVAQHGLFAPELSYVDVSYLADTVLLLRYFEMSGEILQAISVLKKRTGGHERTLRQLRISAQGLEIGEPLRQFTGIMTMTGVPQYQGEEPILPAK